MKRHKQLPGVRRWAGDDLIELQSEPLKAIDAIFVDYPLCVVSGCEVTANEGGDYTISPGYVTLRNPDEQQGRLMVVPFEGITVGIMPIYLVLSNIPQDRVYGDGAIKPVCDNYFAYPTAVVPDMPHLTISETNTTRFVDLVQSKAMETKVDKVTGKGLSSCDYTILEKTKVATINWNKGVLRAGRVRYISNDDTHKIENLLGTSSVQFINEATNPHTYDIYYRVTHNLGHLNYIANVVQEGLNGYPICMPPSVVNLTTDYFDVIFYLIDNIENPGRHGYISDFSFTVTAF